MFPNQAFKRCCRCPMAYRKYWRDGLSCVRSCRERLNCKDDSRLAVALILDPKVPLGTEAQSQFSHFHPCAPQMSFPIKGCECICVSILQSVQSCPLWPPLPPLSEAHIEAHSAEGIFPQITALWIHHSVHYRKTKPNQINVNYVEIQRV